MARVFAFTSPYNISSLSVWLRQAASQKGSQRASLTALLAAWLGHTVGLSLSGLMDAKTYSYADKAGVTFLDSKKRRLFSSVARLTNVSMKRAGQ